MSSLLVATAFGLPEYSAASSVVFLRAETSPELIAHKAQVVCHQTLFPAHRKLAAHGFTFITELPPVIEHALFHATKFKEENRATFIDTLRRLKPGGSFLVALSNDLGAARFEKMFFSLCEGEHFSISKQKSRVFGVRNFIALSEAALETQPSEATSVFAKGTVDRGSELLANAVASRLSGRGADLGAGAGYLSQRVLTESPSVVCVSLFEVEKRALTLAQTRLAPFGERAHFEWSDVTTGVGEHRYDWCITNPPFHAGKHADADLGLRFIMSGYTAIVPGGRLYVVQNKHLPYLRTARTLGALDILVDQDGFLVWELTKPT